MCFYNAEKMNIATDEYGNPFIILREQEEKKRLKGIDAHKASVQSLVLAGGTAFRMSFM